MKIFADTASLDELKELKSWGIVDGCTTNPKIVATEGADFEKRMKEILKLVEGPVSIEVTSNDLDQMVKEGREFASWGKNVVIKLPMTINGLKALQFLKKEGIKTNLTACMSVNQAIIAGKAGATYVSLFYSRIGDSGADAKEVVRKSADIFSRQGINSEIIVGSIRVMSQINEAAEAGAHVVTIPYKILLQMTQNAKTDETIDEFLKFWQAYRKKK